MVASSVTPNAPADVGHTARMLKLLSDLTRLAGSSSVSSRGRFLDAAAVVSSGGDVDSALVTDRVTYDETTGGLGARFGRGGAR